MHAKTYWRIAFWNHLGAMWIYLTFKIIKSSSSPVLFDHFFRLASFYNFLIYMDGCCSTAAHSIKVTTNDGVKITPKLYVILYAGLV